MRAKPVIVVGHAVLDHVYQIEAFPQRPTKLTAKTHVMSGGGMAANAAAAIARLGGGAILWARVGDDTAGHYIIDELVASGVDTRDVRRIATSRSPTSVVIVDLQGERLIISEDDHDLPRTADWLPLERIALAGALLSDLTWLEGTMRAFEHARAHGVPTLLDVDLGSGPLLPMALPLTDYAIFSAPAFAQFITGATTEERIQFLLESGAQHAGVTLGAKGYVWANRAGECGEVPAHQVSVVDTTGAGDAFHGAFALGLAAGLSDPSCAQLATAVAGLSCRGLGARSALPDAAEVASVLDGTKAEEILAVLAQQ